MEFFKRLFGRSDKPAEKPSSPAEKPKEKLDPQVESAKNAAERFAEKSGTSIEYQGNEISEENLSRVLQEAENHVLQKVPELGGSIPKSWTSTGSINVGIFTKGLTHPETQQKMDLIGEFLSLRKSLNILMPREEKAAPAPAQTKEYVKPSKEEKEEGELEFFKNTVSQFLKILSKEGSEASTEEKLRLARLLSELDMQKLKSDSGFVSELKSLITTIHDQSGRTPLEDQPEYHTGQNIGAIDNATLKADLLLGWLEGYE